MLNSLISFTAMGLAVYGSKLFVKGEFTYGAQLFLIGNSLNILLGFSIGNIWLSIAQFGLLWFTLPMVNYVEHMKFYKVLFIGIATVALSMNYSVLEFVASPMDIVATIGAWYGAYCMSKANWKVMAIMWILADIGFLYIGITEGLYGLAIQATIFVYHGYLRLRA